MNYWWSLQMLKTVFIGADLGKLSPLCTKKWPPQFLQALHQIDNIVCLWQKMIVEFSELHQKSFFSISKIVKKHSLGNCYRAETATPLFMRKKSKRVILLPCLGPNTFTCWKGRNPLFLQKCKPLYCALFNFPLDYSCLHTIWPFLFNYLPFFIYFLKSETSFVHNVKVQCNIHFFI